MSRSVALFAAVLLVAAPTRAAEAPKDPLEPLAWAVGGTWEAELAGAGQDPLTVQAVFTWAGHKKAIKYVITVRGKAGAAVQYDGTYYWHPGKKALALLQVDREGNVVESTLTTDGKTITQENAATKSDGTATRQRVEIARDGDDAFTTKAFVRKGDAWVEAVTFKYKRKPAAK